MKTAVLTGLAAALFAGYVRWENDRLSVETYQFTFPSLPEAFDKTRFVFLTDLHNHCFGQGNERLLEAIRGAEPEFILIGGDMIISRHPRYNNRTKEFLCRLAEEYPVYYTNGNHEENRKRATREGREEQKRYEWDLRKAGVRFLHNEVVYLEKKGSRIAVAGLEPPALYYKKGRIRRMNQEVMNCLLKKPEKFTILLAHTPFYFQNYADWGADLVLSGHVHGGMIRLPLIGGVASPQYTLFPKYDAGVYTRDGSLMLLSRGLGLHTLPIRMWNRPELSVICLRKKVRKEGKEEKNGNTG